MPICLDYTNHTQICNYNLLGDCATKLTAKRHLEAELDSMEIAPGSPVDALVIEPFHRECAKPDSTQNNRINVIEF